MSDLLDARVDARPLAITRMLVGLGAMAMAFDSRSLVVRMSAPGKLRMANASWLPEPTIEVANSVFVLLLLAGALLTIGVLARIAAATCAVLAVVPMALDQQAYSNHGILLAALAGLLVLAEPAEAFSLRGRRWRDGTGTVRYWPLFLMKVQITSLYAFTAVAKLNESYFTDETLRSASAGWVRDLTPDAGYLVAAIGVLTAEAFLAVGLWVHRTRRTAFVVGIGLHGALVLFGWAPIGLVPFALLALASYPLFSVSARPSGHPLRTPSDRYRPAAA